MQQLQERDAADVLRQQSRWAGSFNPGRRSWPWWAESHDRVLARVRAAEWPTRLLDVEALSGQLAGDEFYERLSAPGPGTGLTPAGWLQALAETAIKAMGADFAADGKEWPKLWAFCCGLAYEESLEELEAAADVIAERGLTPVPGIPVAWYQPTAGADVLAARDTYGARFLLIAPFSDPGQPADPDHWYAWDLDWCTDGLVVAAGAYGSAAEALAEWRVFAGPSAATAELASCPPELGIRLLDPALADSPQAKSVFGDEPAEFLREIPRLSRRASALTASLGRLLSKEPSSPPRAPAIPLSKTSSTGTPSTPTTPRIPATRPRKHWNYSWPSGDLTCLRTSARSTRAPRTGSRRARQSCATATSRPGSIRRCLCCPTGPNGAPRKPPSTPRLPTARSPPPAPRQQSWPARRTPSLKTRPPSAAQSSEHGIDHHWLSIPFAEVTTGLPIAVAARSVRKPEPRPPFMRRLDNLPVALVSAETFRAIATTPCLADGTSAAGSRLSAEAWRR